MLNLFSPFVLRGRTLRNRIVMSPMCMYSANEDGLVTDWHLAHLAARAIGGVGMIITEATAVEARGRISPNDLGLWNDQQIAPFERMVRLCQSQGAIVCTQLAHAGRKAWSARKGVGSTPLIAPSALAFDTDWVVPQELSRVEIDAVVAAFRDAARRALAAGFDAIEIHAAHGYLLHQFLSPISNHRSDEYGGSLENRARLLRRVVNEVRQVWPAEQLLLVRVSCTDWVAGGLVVDDLVQVARWLQASGVDALDCSSGGNVSIPPPASPGYQVPFAETIRRATGVPTIAVGLITTPQMAEEIVQNGCADLVALGRELLRHPHWPLDAARSLGHDIAWPQQYVRAKPID